MNEIVRTDERLEVAASILDAISYPLRLRIAICLIDREATGGELSDEFGTSYPALARHLRLLRVAGVLRRRRDGSHVWYATAPAAVDLIRAAIACADAQKRTVRVPGSGAHPSDLVSCADPRDREE